MPLPERIDSTTEMDVVTATTSLFCPSTPSQPACAYAVLSLIDSVKPDYILIEGPDTFNLYLFQA